MLFSPATLSIGVALWWGIWATSRAIYNVYFHPLAKFPGPKLAGMTTWWKTYIECFQKASMVKVVAGLHKKHGKKPRSHRFD